MLDLADFIVLHVSYRNFVNMNPQFMSRREYLSFCIDQCRAFHNTNSLDNLIPDLIEEIEFVAKLHRDYEASKVKQ